MADEKQEVQEEVQEAPEVKEEPKEKKEEPKERTEKNFKKLKKNNKDLKKKVVEYESVIDSLKPKAPTPPAQATNQVPDASQFKNLSQEQVEDAFAGMMDQEGYLDGNKLMGVLKTLDKRANDAEERARRAEQVAQEGYKRQSDFEESSAIKKVHKKYPMLDPKNTDVFNEDFFDDVRNDLISQMVNGRQDFEEAANKVYNRHYKDQYEKEVEEVATKKQKEEAVEKQEAKRQINAVRPKSPVMKGYYENEEDKVLRDGVLKGRKGALAEVLRRSGN